MHWIDIAIILSFIAYAIGSGIKSSGVASQNVEEYFLAGRSLKGWQAGLSMAATQFAADTPLLVTGLIATAGIFALWRLWIYALSFLLIGFVLAPSWRRASVITDAELTEIRYGKAPAAWLRGIKAVYFGTIFNCTVLAMVLLAATRIAEPFLTWDAWLPGWAYDPLRSLVYAIHVPITIVDYANPNIDQILANAANPVWAASTNNLISIGTIVLVTLFYSTTGGLRSVVATDLMQLLLAMLATAGFAWYVVSEAGGMGAVVEAIRKRFADGGPGGITPTEILAFTPSRAKDATFAVCAVLGLQWLLQLNADGTGYLAQRTMACRSARDAKQASLVLTVVQIFLRSLLWLPLGLALLVLYPPDLSQSLETIKASSEASYVTGVQGLPVGLKGLMLAGMLAALASTVDTHLNWGASYWTNDLYGRFFCQGWLKRDPDPRTQVWVARGSNVCILLIALVIMSQMRSIQTAWQTSLLLGSGMGVILILRWIWWRVNAWGELACIATSLVLAPILLIYVRAPEPMPAVAAMEVQGDAPPEDVVEAGGPGFEATRLLLMAMAATAAGVGVSLAVGPESRESLRAFYRRVHPPGFWGPIAREEGEDPAVGRRTLGRGLLAAGLAAISIFGLLTGVGAWLCGSPAPTWVPWRGAWIAANVLVGLGLVPLWWRLAFAPDPVDLAPTPATAA